MSAVASHRTTHPLARSVYDITATSTPEPIERSALEAELETIEKDLGTYELRILSQFETLLSAILETVFHEYPSKKILAIVLKTIAQRGDNLTCSKIAQLVHWFITEKLHLFHENTQEAICDILSEQLRFSQSKTLTGEFFGRQIQSILAEKDLLFLDPYFRAPPEFSEAFLEKMTRFWPLEQTVFFVLALNGVNDPRKDPVNSWMERAIFPNLNTETSRTICFLFGGVVGRREVEQYFSQLRFSVDSQQHTLFRELKVLSPAAEHLEELRNKIETILTQRTLNWTFPEILFFMIHTLERRQQLEGDPVAKIRILSNWFRDRILPSLAPENQQLSLQLLSETEYLGRDILREEIGLRPLTNIHD